MYKHRNPQVYFIRDICRYLLGTIDMADYVSVRELSGFDSIGDVALQLKVWLCTTTFQFVVKH